MAIYQLPKARESTNAFQQATNPWTNSAGVARGADGNWAPIRGSEIDPNKQVRQGWNPQGTAFGFDPQQQQQFAWGQQPPAPAQPAQRPQVPAQQPPAQAAQGVAQPQQPKPPTNNVFDKFAAANVQGSAFRANPPGGWNSAAWHADDQSGWAQPLVDYNRQIGMIPGNATVNMFRANPNGERMLQWSPDSSDNPNARWYNLNDLPGMDESFGGGSLGGIPGPQLPPTGGNPGSGSGGGAPGGGGGLPGIGDLFPPGLGGGGQGGQGGIPGIGWPDISGGIPGGIPTLPDLGELGGYLPGQLPPLNGPSIDDLLGQLGGWDIPDILGGLDPLDLGNYDQHDPTVGLGLAGMLMGRVPGPGQGEIPQPGLREYNTGITAGQMPQDTLNSLRAMMSGIGAPPPAPGVSSGQAGALGDLYSQVGANGLGAQQLGLERTMSEGLSQLGNARMQALADAGLEGQQFGIERELADLQGINRRADQDSALQQSAIAMLFSALGGLGV